MALATMTRARRDLVEFHALAMHGATEAICRAAVARLNSHPDLDAVDAAEESYASLAETERRRLDRWATHPPRRVLRALFAESSLSGPGVWALAIPAEVREEAKR
jgi:DNA-binding transcriptional regulator PaaX